jgi:ribosomal protein S18 acetylase RimI-like enzyme
MALLPVTKVIARRVRGKPTTAWMSRFDLPPVLEIERRSSELPWSAEEFGGFFSADRRNHHGAVVTAGGRVLGYVLFEKRGRSLLVVRAAVHPDFRRKGLGRTLLRFLSRLCSATGRIAVVAEADEHDTPARLWLRACGVPCVQVREGTYCFVGRG